MATIYAGSNGFIPGGTKTIHAGKGALLALVISHAEGTAQTVTLYDSLSAAGVLLARFVVAPEQSPAYLRFSDGFPLRFSTGLTMAAGDCSVVVIATGGA
jgi:hypothetical protein